MLSVRTSPSFGTRERSCETFPTDVLILDNPRNQYHINFPVTRHSKTMDSKPAGYDGSPTGVDLSAFPAAAALVSRVGEFMKEVQNM
jgi:hypothetical protein